MGQLAVENLLTNLGDALGAEGVPWCGASRGGLFLLIALQEGLVAPLGGKGLVGADAVEPLEDHPCALCRINDGFLGIFNRF